MNLTEQANQATLTEAVDMLGIAYETLRCALRRGAFSAAKLPAINKRGDVVPQWHVDLDEVEAWKTARKRALESKDKYELARIRGIKVRSAERAIRRANKNC